MEDLQGFHDKECHLKVPKTVLKHVPDVGLIKLALNLFYFPVFRFTILEVNMYQYTVIKGLGGCKRFQIRPELDKVLDT